MDEDIKFQIDLTTSSGVAVTQYGFVPYRSTFRNAWAVANGDPGDAVVITVTGGGVTLGTLTFGSTIDAGAQATWAANTTYGDTVMDADATLTFVTDTNPDATVKIDIMYELDPKARAA